MPATELAADPFANIIGSSPSLKAALQQVSLTAQLSYPVLFLGPTGTGKNLLAGAIHNVSHRRNKPFIEVLCSAIPPGLLEAELFGAKKGAYTGSIRDHHGRFQQAEDGTLFLDEITEIPMWLQAKLLGVFNKGEYWPVGSESPLQLNARIVAATNIDLWGQVVKGEFRMDLFYRLNVIPIQVPSLQERRDDIPQLVEYLTTKFNMANGTSVHFADEAIADLVNHEWPGNIRQLENLLIRICALSFRDEVIKQKVVRRFLTEERAASSAEVPDDLSLEAAERRHIQMVLRRFHGRVAGAAGILGIERKTLYAKMHRLKIDPEVFR